MKENILIRRITSKDIFQLQNIGKQTFTETFSDSNTKENLQKYLETSFSETKLIEELSNPHSEFYFAMSENQPIGYLKVNFGASQTEIQDETSLEIERIYVLRAFQGLKVGQLLFDKAMDIARQHHVNYVWLGVWEENQRAIRFYEKNGFVVFNKHIFKLGADEQTDWMMKLELK